MATTLLQLRTETYEILNDLETSNVYSSDFIDQTLNDQQVEVCAIKKWQFLRNKKLFLAPDDTTTTTAIATSDTTIDLTAVTNMESAGGIWIDHDVIEYTGISTLQLTGVTNIDIAHDLGAKVYPLIAVPSDYERMPQLMMRKSGSEQFSDVLYVDEIQWSNTRTGGAQIDNKYTIVNGEDNSNLYIRMEKVSVGDYMVFYYLKKPTTMSDDADTATIPDPWALKVLPKLAAYKAMYLRNDNLEGLGSIIEAQAKQELLAMKKYYGSREEGPSRLVQPTYRSGVRENFNRKRVRI